MSGADTSSLRNPPGGVTAEAMMVLLRQALGDQTPIELINESHLHRGHAGATEGSHWRVVVRGERLAGLTPVARHRLVYDALLPLFDLGLHALAIDAKVA